MSQNQAVFKSDYIKFFKKYLKKYFKIKIILLTRFFF